MNDTRSARYLESAATKRLVLFAISLVGAPASDIGVSPDWPVSPSSPLQDDEDEDDEDDDDDDDDDGEDEDDGDDITGAPTGLSSPIGDVPGTAAPLAGSLMIVVLCVIVVVGVCLLCSITTRDVDAFV